MAKPPIPAHLTELLQRPNPAVMATVRPDGTPVTVATWYLWDAGRILLNLEAGRSRLRHLEADPRASLTILDGDSWHRHLSVQGTVTLQPDEALTDIDRLAQQYIDKPYPIRDKPRVTAWLTITAYHAWGLS